MMSGPGPGHPGMHPGAHPSAYAPGAPPGSHPGGPMYAPPGGDYMANSSSHMVATRGLAPTQQPMMMPHQTGAYMGNPPAGPPYM